MRYLTNGIVKYSVPDALFNQGINTFDAAKAYYGNIRSSKAQAVRIIAASSDQSQGQQSKHDKSTQTNKSSSSNTISKIASSEVDIPIIGKMSTPGAVVTGVATVVSGNPISGIKTGQQAEAMIDVVKKLFD